MLLMSTGEASSDTPQSDIHMTTIRILELLPIDLIGPMQVESLRGKRYAFMCVNNFLDIHGYTFSGKNQTPLMHLKHYF